MAMNTVKENTLQCSSCPNKFLLSSGSSSEDETVCQFCRQKRLLQELRRAEEELKNAVVCPNRHCNTVIPHTEVHKHSWTCMYAYFACPYTNCTFRGSKVERDVHTGRCEYRLVPCPDCGKCLGIWELEQHRTQCREPIQCDLCGMVVSNSVRRTHDAWYCPQRGLMSFCRDCKRVFSHADLQRHLDTCTAQRVHDVSEESPMSPPPSKRYSPMLLYDRVAELPDYSQITDNSQHKRPTNSPQNDDNVFSRLPETPNSTLNPVPIPREVLLGALSVPGSTVDPYMRTSGGVYRRPVRVSPTARAKWHMLMAQIEENLDEFRDQLAKERYLKSSRTVSV